jgi:hypothetical protein
MWRFFSVSVQLQMVILFMANAALHFFMAHTFFDLDAVDGKVQVS